MAPPSPNPERRIPKSLTDPGAPSFWLAVVLTGVGAGLSAAGLTRLLDVVQGLAWPSATGGILDGARHAAPGRHVVVLASAGLLTGLGQLLLRRLTDGNGIDITAAIWFSAGRLPKARTLGSAVLSIFLVGMGTSLGREGAPKQFGAVLANAVADRTRLTDEQRRLLVACGAGAGMAAAYGVPLGGALFALEVLRGVLALRLVLPALMTAVVATAVSWFFLPNASTYTLPALQSSPALLVWALAFGPVAGLVAVGFVRAIAFAERHKPQGHLRIVAPVLVLGLLGVVSIPFPELLGNGRDVSQLVFAGQLAPGVMLVCLLLKPAAVLLCFGSGAPGGLFTPSLTLGALLGGALGYAFSQYFPGDPSGAFALVGATAMLAATTQGPISAVVLMMELTGRDRTIVVPTLLAVIAATLVARTVEPRSIYDARLTDEEVQQRLRAREPSPG